MSSMNSTKVWGILRTVYYDHIKRGEEIEEFNLNPEWFAFFKQPSVNIRRGVVVSITSRGWFKINDHWYHDPTPYIRTTQYTIKLRE